jgi:hypothetical protein
MKSRQRKTAISSRYPELVGRITKFNLALARKQKDIPLADGTTTVDFDLVRGKRSFWKVEYPIFRSWSLLQKREMIASTKRP